MCYALYRISVLMCSAGQSMNRWSLEELVKRDPENFLILLQQIIRKTKEVTTLSKRSFTLQNDINSVVTKHLFFPLCVCPGSGAVSV